MSNDNEWTAEAAEAEAEQLDVKLSTEGARHVPAAELRERAVLEANEARARIMAAHDRLEFGDPADHVLAARAEATRSIEEHNLGDGVKTLARYDADNKCLECGGPRTEHDFDCRAVARAAAVGVPLGRRFRDGASIELQLPPTQPETCHAETRVKRNLHNHTHRCQKLGGHEGGHEWKDGAGRTVIWYGEAQPLPTDMRYRFGLDPHWMMKRPGRKTMAGDFDSEW